MPTLPERLRRYSEACLAERLDPDFAAAVSEATASLEQKEPRSAGSETTVLLTPDAIFLLQNYPQVINDLAARVREKLEHRLEDLLLHGENGGKADP